MKRKNLGYLIIKYSTAPPISMKASAPRTIFLLEVCLLDELAAGYTKSKSLLCLEIKQYHWYILRQWIALKVFSDWLLKLQISFAIHLQVTHTGFAPENILTVAGLKETKSSFCVILSHCFSFH